MHKGGECTAQEGKPHGVCLAAHVTDLGGGGLALPLALQPFLYPGLTREADRPLAQRYALKANVWLAIFGWVGNYWYTHYFYSVLKAEYTFPAHDLNGVPVAMFFATHFYFSL